MTNFSQGSEDATNPESSKRQRLTPVPGDQIATMDVTRVSDTVMNSSDNKSLSKSIEVEEIISKTGALDDQQENQITSLLKRANKAHSLGFNVTY